MKSFHAPEWANRYAGKICTIVGKGPSVEFLSSDDFGKETGPVIGIRQAANAAIRFCGIRPLFGLELNQQNEGNVFSPLAIRSGTILAGPDTGTLFDETENAYRLDWNDIGPKAEWRYSVQVAMRLAKWWGCRKMVLIGFDASTHEGLGFFKGVKHEDSKYGDPARYLKQKQRFIDELIGMGLEFEFRTPDRKCRLDWSFVIPTRGNAARALEFSKNIPRDREFIFITPDLESAPVGRVAYFIRPLEGPAKATDYGMRQARGKWVAWLADDLEFESADWFSRLQNHRRKNPRAKVIGFNDKLATGEPRSRGRWAAYGAADREWFVSHYPSNPFGRYGWDNDVRDWAASENVWSFAEEIGIRHPVDLSARDSDREKIDRNLWHRRREEYDKFTA